jgi:pyruvate ferredoxin oxidoreductase beta subunit
MKPQGRFKHLFAPANEWLLKKVQEEVDKEWEKLKKQAECGC